MFEKGDKISYRGSEFEVLRFIEGEGEGTGYVIQNGEDSELVEKPILEDKATKI